MKNIFFVITILFVSFSFAKESKDDELLVSTVQTDIKKNGQAIETFETVEKVITEAGRSTFSIMKVSFSKADSAFKILEAYSLNDGKKSLVSLSSVKIRNADKADHGIGDLTEAVIPFDQVNIGTEIHLRYQLISKPVLKNIYSTVFHVSNQSLAKKENYTYTSEVPFSTAEENFEPYFKITKENSKPPYRIFIEPTQLAYAFVGSHVEVADISITTAKSWEQLREEEANLFEPILKRRLPAKYQDIVKSAEGLKTEKEIFNKVAAEINKVITYSGNWQTQQGKMMPKSMDGTAFQGKGDCKDYTTAMVAILRKMGFDANPVLTFRSSSYMGERKLQSLATVPNFNYFNHVIVHVKGKDGRVWWIDPTNPYVQADNVTSDILGNFGLLLDNKSTTASFLPTENPQPANFTLEQTLTLSADNSVLGKGFVEMTPSSYNSIGMVGRLYGNQGIEKVLAMLLNAMSRKTQVEISKTDPEKGRLDFGFYGTDWVMDETKSKYFTSFNPAGIYSYKIGIDADADIGEVGTTTIITHLKKQKAIDNMGSGCFLRSQWLDADRIVENKSDEITITDKLTTKIRFISKKEAHGEVFESFLSNLSDCRSSSEIILKFDPSLKTADFLEREKTSGPSVDAMTDQDAERMFNITGPSQTLQIELKLVRYYQNKLVKNSKDADAYFHVAVSIARLGYINGENYVPEYLIEGIQNLNEAIKYAKPEDEPLYYARKIRYLLWRGHTDKALKVFYKLREKAPIHFQTYLSAAKIALRQNNSKDAKQWILASEALAKSDDDKDTFHSMIKDILEKEGDLKAALPHHEYFVSKYPQNAWGWHNLAIINMQMGDNDKAIANELKALSLADFGAARSVISDCYLYKYNTLTMKGRKVASVTSKEDLEALLMNAVKYYPRNVAALAELGFFYAEQYKETKNKFLLSKGRTYLEQGAEYEPNNSNLRSALKLYSSLEGGQPPGPISFSHGQTFYEKK